MNKPTIIIEWQNSRFECFELESGWHITFQVKFINAESIETGTMDIDKKLSQLQLFIMLKKVFLVI